MSSNPISRSEELPVDTIRELSDKIDNLLGIVATKDDISSLNTRLDGIDTRLDGIDTRLDGIDTRLDGIDTRLDGIDNRLHEIESNFIYIRGRLDEVDINRNSGIVHG